MYQLDDSVIAFLSAADREAQYKIAQETLVQIRAADYLVKLEDLTLVNAFGDLFVLMMAELGTRELNKLSTKLQQPSLAHHLDKMAHRINHPFLLTTFGSGKRIVNASQGIMRWMITRAFTAPESYKIMLLSILLESVSRKGKLLDIIKWRAWGEKPSTLRHDGLPNLS